jgi:hypothetical protein
MAKKTRKSKLDGTLTLGDVDLDLEKAYRFLDEGKTAHARQALTRARKRLNAIRGPSKTSAKSPDDESKGAA